MVLKCPLAETMFVWGFLPLLWWIRCLIRPTAVLTCVCLQTGRFLLPIINNWTKLLIDVEFFVLFPSQSQAAAACRGCGFWLWLSPITDLCVVSHHLRDFLKFCWVGGVTLVYFEEHCTGFSPDHLGQLPPYVDTLIDRFCLCMQDSKLHILTWQFKNTPNKIRRLELRWVESRRNRAIPAWPTRNIIHLC